MKKENLEDKVPQEEPSSEGVGERVIQTEKKRGWMMEDVNVLEQKLKQRVVRVGSFEKLSNWFQKNICNLGGQKDQKKGQTSEIPRTPEQLALEKEFKKCWDNVPSHEISDRAYKIIDEMEKIDAKRGLYDLDRLEYFELALGRAFEENKDYYLGLYLERKEIERQRVEGLLKRFDKISFPGGKPSLKLSQLEQEMYDTDGEMRPDFEEFFQQLLHGVEDGRVDLRYFPMLDPRGKNQNVNTPEQFDDYRYNRNGIDNRNSTVHYYLGLSEDRRISVRMDDSMMEFNNTHYDVHTDEITSDRPKNVRNENFSIQLNQYDAVLCCFFPMKDCRGGNVIKLRLRYNLENPQSEEMVKILKENPWYMVGIFKEMSEKFPVDIYKFIKDSFSLWKNVDASELNKKYGESPKTLELKNLA